MMPQEAAIMSARPLGCGSIVPALTFALTAFLSSDSGAIQLRWKSGASDLSFAEARSCTLLVQADSGSALPSDWRLLWVTESSSGPAPVLSFESEPEARGDPAAACEMVAPTDPSDVAGRTLGARFCASTMGAASIARLIVRAPGGALAKFQVVGFAPSFTDSMEGATERSNEVTLNGGCATPYPPVVFRAASTHRLGQLDVRLVGANLRGVGSVPISARDSSWTYPLALTSKSDSRITARAVLAAPLPEIVVGAEDGFGGLGAAAIAADSFPPLSPQACFSTFEGSADTAGMQPKDFAVVPAGDSWHIFYTRQYMTGYTDRTNTRRIGHAVSTDQHLSSWTVVNRNAIQVREGRIWDNLHVWAPTIVRKPGDITYYMFYTGVQLDTLSQSPNLVTSEIQRIGVATSVDLDTWTQDSTPVFHNKKTSWAFQDSSSNVEPLGGGLCYSDTWQFRDPFVMQDPDSAGRWLLYYVTIDSALIRYVVGVARTQGTDLRAWKDVWPLRRTSTAFMNAGRNESPHALHRNGNWWLLYTSNYPAGDLITYTLNATSPSDSAGWARPDSLKAITCGQHGFPSSLNQWHATEYVGIGSQEYLSAFADNLFGGGVIQFAQIVAPDGTCPSDSMRLDCPNVWTAVEPASGPQTRLPIALRVSGASPARGVVSLRLTVSQQARVCVAVYDLLGRRVRTLLDGWALEGTRILNWDGRTEHGACAGSGIYFVRATDASGRAVVRIPMLR
jgi:hypothetical protein